MEKDKTGILKKAVSICSSGVRLLIGAGALALVVIGIKGRRSKKSKDTD